MKKLFILLILLSGCMSPVDKVITSKGIVTGFFEIINNADAIKATVQDTSGKIFFITKDLCTNCLVGDSVILKYHDNSLIKDAGDKYQIDSCIKFYNAAWKASQYTKTLYFYDDSGRLIKKIDTTFIKQ